ATLDDHEEHERQDPDAKRRKHQRMTAAERRPFEQAEYDAAQANDRQARAEPVDSGRPRRIAALIHEAPRQGEDDNRQGPVEEEHGAPTDMLDQPTACDRADRRRHRTESRPRPDRLPAIDIVEGGTDDGEAARN